MMQIINLAISVIFLNLFVCFVYGGPEEEHGVKYADKCEGTLFIL